MKKIGILLAFAPEQPIKNQGIGRLTAFIISAIQKDKDLKIVIAMPGWYKSTIIDFLEDHQIDVKEVELITTDGIPCLLYMRNILKNLFIRYSKTKTKENFNVQAKISLFNFSFLFKSLATASFPYFLLINILLIFGFMFLSPVILVSFVFLFLVKKIKPRVSKVFCKFKNNLKQNLNFLIGPLSLFRRNIFIHRLYQEIRKVELGKLIKKINRNTGVSAWFVPTLFWPEIADIKVKKVVAAPDAVFLDFPLLFAKPFFAIVSDQIARTIKAADHFICYSHHVKNVHLVDGFSVAPDRISVIKHGSIDLRQYLLRDSFSDIKAASDHILQNYQRKYLAQNDYLRYFDLANASYIFYSSQIRPHKNFLSLIKAYEILLRQRYINIKFITTANLMQEKEIWDYIVSRRLQYDILCFSDVSSEMLAALNHNAVCAVNPTLFEGGFPFTFTEAYSVGTPSVMSNIPVVLAEISDEALREKMLFDPYHVNDIVNKVEWAISHREELIVLQKPLYEEFEKRSWEIVANDYLKVLNSADHSNDIILT